MARISNSEIQSVFDILSADAFEFELGAVPNVGPNRRLRLLTSTLNYPGYSNEAYEVPLHGHVRRFRGRKVYSRQMTVSYYEDQNMVVTNTFRAWHEFIVGTNSGNSQDYIDGYAINPILRIFDHTGRQIDALRFRRFFPQDIAEVSMDGSTSQAVQVSVTFSYDYFEPDTSVGSSLLPGGFAIL